MYEIPAGDYVRAVLSSSDLTTAAAISFVDRAGNTRTIAAGEVVVLSDIAINNGGTASVVTIFQDQDNSGTVDAGETLYAASLAANSQNHGNFTTPVISLKKSATAANGVIKAKASAASASTTVIVVGTVVKA